MTDPRYIPPSDRGAYPSPTEIEEGDLVTRCRMLFVHATLMDERDARQRDLIGRLADSLYREYAINQTHGAKVCAYVDALLAEALGLVAEARGVEATNE